jgi:transposase
MLAEQRDALTRFLFAEVTRLSAQVTALLAEVAELKARINKNSQNSSKPPSSDGLAKKKKTRSLRGKSNKKQGGQIGRKGTALKLSENPTKVIRYPLSMHCHGYGDVLSPDGARCRSVAKLLMWPS